MKNKFFTLILFVTYGFQFSVAQTIENVIAERKLEGVVSVSFNLVDGSGYNGSYFIRFYYKNINGEFVEVLNHLSGDFGPNQKSGFAKKILWNPFYDTTFQSIPESQIKIVAIPTNYKDFILVGGRMVIDSAYGSTPFFMQPFYLSKYELTVSQFADFVKETNYVTDAEKGEKSFYINSEGDLVPNTGKLSWKLNPSGNEIDIEDYDHPVSFVSPTDAEAFAKHYGCRLPTDFEWEMSANNYSNIDISLKALDSLVQFNNNSRRKSNYKIASLKPTVLGFYDIYGNNWELVKSARPGKQGDYFQMGGSFNTAKEFFSITMGGKVQSKYSTGDLGFRLAKDVNY
jgi:hypothetical protein